MKKLMTIFAFMALIVAAGNAQSVKKIENSKVNSSEAVEDVRAVEKVGKVTTEKVETEKTTDAGKKECKHGDKSKGKDCCAGKKASSGSGCGSKAKAKSGCCASKAKAAAKSEEEEM